MISYIENLKTVSVGAFTYSFTFILALHPTEEPREVNNSTFFFHSFESMFLLSNNEEVNTWLQ